MAARRAGPAASCASNPSACAQAVAGGQRIAEHQQPHRRRAAPRPSANRARAMMAFRRRPRTPYGAAMDAIPPSPVPLVQVRNLHLTVPSAAGPVNILRGIDLDIAAGEAVGIVGPSGSGKTSLLMVLAGLERATAGSIVLAGQAVTAMDEDALARLRRDDDRHRVPGVPPDPDHDRAGERRRAAGTGRRARCHGAGAHGAGCGRAGASADPSARPAVRRRAAARGARPRLRPAAAAAAGRRADRQPGPGDRRGGDGPAVPPARRDRHHAAADHPRPASGRALLAAGPSGGRAGGGDRSVAARMAEAVA